MKRIRPVLAVAVVALAAGAASGTGVSPRAGTLRAAIELGITGAATVPADLAALQKAEKFIDKKTNAKSLAAEIGSAAKAGKATTSLTFAGAAAVNAAFQTASDGYLQDLLSARAQMQANATAIGLSKKAKSKIGKSEQKLAAQLDAVTGTVPARLALEAKAAASAAGFTPDCDEPLAVISSVQLAGATEGLDLDGDGTGDNALASLVSTAQGLGLAIDVDATLADALATSANVQLLQVWGVDSLAKDPLVFAGLFAGNDTDADPSDNFNGSEAFAVVDGTLAADGKPVLRTATSLKKGVYEFTLTGQTLEIAGVTLPSNSKIVVRGTVTATTHTGKIGAAVPTATLLQIIADAGVDLGIFATQVANFADLDLDGNGTNDAFSTAFTFETRPASLQSQ